MSRPQWHCRVEQAVLFGQLHSSRRPQRPGTDTRTRARRRNWDVRGGRGRLRVTVAAKCLRLGSVDSLIGKFETLEAISTTTSGQQQMYFTPLPYVDWNCRLCYGKSCMSWAGHQQGLQETATRKQMVLSDGNKFRMLNGRVCSSCVGLGK